LLVNRRIWFGFAITAVFLGLLFLQIDLSQTVEALLEGNFVYLIPGIAVYFLAVYFRALRWKFLLSHLKHIPASNLFSVVVVGYMANNLLPVRLGEVVRSYYLSQREGISKSAILGTILLERVMDFLTLVLFLGVAAIVLPVDRFIYELAAKFKVPGSLLVLGILAPFITVVAGIVLAAIRPSLPIRGMAFLLQWLPKKIKEKFVAFLSQFIFGFASLRDLRRVQIMFLLSLPIWFFEATMLYIIGFSFKLHHFFQDGVEMAFVVLAVTAVANIATSIPSSQGGVGPFEFFAIGTLVLSGVSPEIATAYTITMHLALLLPVVIAGLVILWIRNVNFRELIGRVKVK
jgi:hypothetical protein